MVTTLTLVGGAPLVCAETSTVEGQFILDKNEVREGETINLALLALDKNGEVDRFGEGKGSTIMAVIHTIKGEIQGGSVLPGAIPKDTDPTGGYFASQVRYVRLDQGVGRVNIYYPRGIAAAEETTDTVTIYLQERIPTDGGGVNFVQIGETIEKTISIGAESGALPALRVESFVPARNDPQVSSEDKDRKDGITAKMTAGIEGGQITVVGIDETVGNIRRGKRAPGIVRLDLLDKEEGESIYSDEERMVRDKAIFTLTSEITKSGLYDVVASWQDDEEVTSVQINVSDTLEVLPQREARGLKLIADKERIAKPNSEIFDGNDNCPANFPVALVCQGTYINLITLDQFGNAISNTETAEFTVSIVDEAQVASSTALKFKVLQGGGVGIPTDNHDAILGNEKNEIIKLGTTALVARANNPDVSDSEPLAIKVVEDSLLVDVVDGQTKFAQIAGTEFDAFVVRVGNERGQVYLQNQSKTMDYANVNQPTLDPGAIEVIGSPPAEEIRSFFRKSDGTDIVKGLFKVATIYDTYSNSYLISDRAGKYSQVRVYVWEIAPAAATQVRYLNAIGEDILEVSPYFDEDTKQYKTTIYESAFSMYDNFGNPITNLGDMKAESVNGKVTYSGNRDYGQPGKGGTIEVVYETTGRKAFSGKDEIKFAFTEPGLGNTEFVIVSNIPVPDYVTEVGTITPYIETTSIPVNSEVALTLEKKHVDVMRVILGGEGDSLVPEVYEINWKDIELSAKQCEDADGTFDNGECQLNETQCQAADGIFRDDKCQQQEELLIASGLELDFKGSNRKLLTIKAGSREGRFTLNFNDANNAELEKSLIFTVTGPVVIVPPEETPEPTPPTDTDKAQCEGEGNFWEAEECKVLAVLNNPGDKKNSAVLASDGTIAFTSNAQFTGGAAFDGGNLEGISSMQLTAEGSSVLFVGSINFDSEDVGEQVDIVIAVSYSHNPLLGSDGNIVWWSRTADGIPEWDMNPANLEAYKVAHLIEEGNLTLPLLMYEGTLGKENISPGTINVYIGYRLENGLIKFGAQPIIFQMF